MSSNASQSEFEMIHIIVNFGLGSKVLQTAKKCGISGGTVLLGRGTMKRHLLDTRKEIILMVSDQKTIQQTVHQLELKLKISRPNHGIAFTTSVGKIVGARSAHGDLKSEGRGVGNTMYHAITVIVEKGNAEYVIDAATEAGSKGGTIINARGSGIHETSKLFLMDIEPEKEMVLILSEKEDTEAIVTSINQTLKLDEPGNGIIFIQDVNKTYGLYK